MIRRLEHDWFSKPLPENIEIGDRSWLYSSFAFLHYDSKAPVGVRLGRDTGVYNGTFFDLGRDVRVEVGDYCSLVGAIFSTNGRVSIGDYTFIAHEVVIADSFWMTPLPFRTPLPATPERVVAGNEIHIGKNVWIGARAIVAGKVRIGDNSVIGAGTLVTRDVPANVVCAGNPLRVVKSVSNA